MPYPTKYDRQFDYVSYQNSNPTRPLPATKVNADLNFVQQSTKEIVDFLKTSIRADGKIMNAAIGRDQIDPSVNLGFTPPTEWEAGVLYTANTSTVFHGDAFYSALVTHTSAGSFEPTKWLLIADFHAIADKAAVAAIASNPNLHAISQLASAADKGIVFTGAGTAMTFDLSVFSRTLLAGASAAAMRTALGLALVASSGAYGDLSGKPTLGTAAALNVGTVAGNVVQLDGSARLPPVDGSQLTGLAGGGDMLKAKYFASVKDYGAVGDGVQITSNVTITSGTAALTVSGASFTAGDVGKAISVPGAGSAGGTLVTTILGYTSATQVTLNANASTTVSGTSQRVVYGTNDITVLNSAIAALNAGTIGRLYMPKGVYIANGTITTISGMGTIYGDGVGSTYIMNMSATGDIVTVSGTMNIESLAIYSSVFPRTSGISLNLTGNSSYVHNVDVLYAYLGVQSAGVLNLLVNVNINMLTSRNIAAGSGGVLNTGTILSCFNVKMGSGTHVNADMAEFGFKILVGELDLTQCFVFLVNQGLSVPPGSGQTVLGVNAKGCWFDTTVGYGINVSPQHATAIVQLVWISDTWIAPGGNSANGYGIVIDNTVGATLQKLWFTSCYALSYNHNAGNGVYLKGANISAYFSNCTIGGAMQAFSVGVNALAGTTKFGFPGGSIAYNGTGVTLAAGCDYFTFNGVNELSSNSALVVDSSTSVNGFFANCPGYSGWKSFTPTLGASSGAPTGTVTGKYLLSGKTITVTYAISLTGGTGAGDLTATLPFACVSGTSFVGHGRDIAAGISLQASVISGGTTVRITTTASNAYPANSAAILATVTYEAA